MSFVNKSANRRNRIPENRRGPGGITAELPIGGAPLQGLEIPVAPGPIPGSMPHLGPDRPIAPLSQRGPVENIFGQFQTDVMPSALRISNITPVNTPTEAEIPISTVTPVIPSRMNQRNASNLVNRVKKSAINRQETSTYSNIREKLLKQREFSSQAPEWQKVQINDVFHEAANAENATRTLEKTGYNWKNLKAPLASQMGRRMAIGGIAGATFAAAGSAAYITAGLLNPNGTEVKNPVGYMAAGAVGGMAIGAVSEALRQTQALNESAVKVSGKAVNIAHSIATNVRTNKIGRYGVAAAAIGLVAGAGSFSLTRATNGVF